MMESWYEIKFRGIMGSGRDEIKEVCILGRRVAWEVDGITYEADKKNRDELLKRMGLEEGSKGW